MTLFIMCLSALASHLKDPGRGAKAGDVFKSQFLKVSAMVEREIAQEREGLVVF